MGDVRKQSLDTYSDDDQTPFVVYVEQFDVWDIS